MGIGLKNRLAVGATPVPDVFIDTYMEQKKSPVNRTYFKITIPHPSVLKGYYCGIGFMFYGIMVILYYMI